MAVFPLSTTFCEVTYDSDWYEDDRHLTPYRYSLLRNDTDSNSDTVSLTLPSYTYYEYLRSLYDCRTTATGRIPPGYPGSSNGRISEDPERARTWHAFGKDTGSELSRAAIRSEPTKIRPAYPFPSLHLIQGGDSGDEYEEEYAFTDRSKQKLVWVDALNKWVPEHQLHPRPYMTFIGNAPVIEQAGRTPHFRENEKPRAKSEYGPRTDVHSYISVVNSKEIRTLRSRPDTFGGGREDHPRVCERFELHMGKTPQPLPKPSNQQRNNEKREAIRKRAQEMAEQRKQRKAYSSPLYTSLADRRLKKRAQSSKSANTAPTSPVQRKEVSSSPRPPIEAWQPNEGDRLKLQTPPKPPLSPVKKEISIKLVKAEDPEPEPAAERPVTPKDKIDKKVKFHEEPTPPTTEKPKSPKKKKDPDELSKEELEAKLALERLKESLEKQRQQQILEQQRILKERELEEERLRIEKEKGEEEEQLKRLKSLEKKPLTQNSSNHENYYKNTMNAADQLFSQKDQKETLKENDKNTKPRTNIHKPIETKNKKNSDLKPVPKKAKIRNEGIINKDKDKIEAKETIVEESETNSKKKPDIVEKISKVSHEKAKLEKGLVKIVEEQDKAIEDNLDPLLKGSKGKQESRKQKGKGKGKIQKVKTPKSDKQTKSTKPAEKEKKGLLKRENTFPQIKKTKKEKVQKLKNLDKKLLDQTTRQFKEVTQTTPQTKPVKAGMTKRPLTMPVLSPKQREPIFKQEIPLPITAPSESKLDNIEEPEEPKPTSAHRERRKSIVQQREIIKKERRDFRKCVKKDDEPEQEKLPEIDTDVRKVESWIYGTDDFSEKKSESSEKSEVQVEALPSLTQDLNPELIEKKKEAKEKRRKSVLANLIATENTIKKWKRPGIKDSSYLDELRRMELAEERRKKQMEMYERLKNRRKSIFGYSTDDGSPSFEDYGFLAKYCIFTKGNIEMYRHAFDAVDDSKAGWLEGEDVMIALRGVNNKLTEAEEEYLYRVLELTGYQITHGADFKMFSVLAALSQRISALDKWMKNFIGKMDFKQLEMKMFKCKTLWECNVDKDSNSISLDQLCVELRAGGVSLEHEMECREKLSHLPSLDLLDFLTYVPLFIMIHESVVTNPLDDSRVK